MPAGNKTARSKLLSGGVGIGEGSMPHYHFDLVNWKAAGGADLADDIEAMNSADVIARRLLEGCRS